MIALVWRRNTSAPVSSAMVRTTLAERGIAVPIAMTSSGNSPSSTSAKRPAFASSIARPAAFGLLRRFRPRPGIQQREFRHALRRLPHDLEGDVTAHRQAGEREARRRGGQDAAGDRRDRVVAGVIGDRHRTKPPQRRNLLGIKPCRAVKPGNQNDGQIV